MFLHRTGGGEAPDTAGERRVERKARGQEDTGEGWQGQRCGEGRGCTYVAVGAGRTRDTRRALHARLAIAPRHANRPHDPRCSRIPRHSVAAHQTWHPLQARPARKPRHPRHSNHPHLPYSPRRARCPPTPRRPWQACRALEAAWAGHPDARCALGTGIARRSHGPAGATRSFLGAETLQFARHAACFGCHRHETRRQFKVANARMRLPAACRLWRVSTRVKSQGCDASTLRNIPPL